MNDSLLENLGIQSPTSSSVGDPLLANLGIKPVVAAPSEAAPIAGNSQPNTGILGNIVLGALKGASDIGTTALQPVDWLLNKTGLTSTSNVDRRTALRDFFQQQADPNSLPFQGGELGADIAGTAGIGGQLATAAKSLPFLGRLAPQVASALESGGFKLATPATTGLGKVGNAALRVGAGSTVGGLSAGTINPDNTEAGAIIGGVLPAGIKVLGEAGSRVNQVMGNTAESLMQSALKPTIEQLRSGKAATTVRTLLDEGINATQGGVGALKAKIADIDNQITQRIANSNATVDKQAIIGALGDTRNRFMNQVNPVSDLGAIDTVEQGFLNHPNIPNNIFPVQQAQSLKQGTYGILAKKYGQLGSAETEAQKSLARGLKEQISAAVPEVGQLNAQESKLIDALSVTERRALMDANKNPMGLAALATNPLGAGAFMADRSALIKSLAARGLNNAAQLQAPSFNPLLIQALRNLAITGGANQIGQQ